MTKQLLQRALDYIENVPDDRGWGDYRDHNKLEEALRKELAKPEAEPVGHIYTINGIQHCTIEKELPDCALYAGPADAIDTSPERVQNSAGNVHEPEAEVVAWMDVDGFVNKYEVSSEGQIRNKLTGKLAPQNATVGAGYTKADFWQDGKHIQTTVHRVVATAFLGPADGREVNHKNGIKSDNRLSNLEWVSKSRNTIHRYYELESTIHPIVSICTTTGKKTKYESVALAVKDGFLSSAIYKCLSGGVHRKHRGFHFIDAKADTSPPDTEAKDKALRVALEALKRCYDVTEWPCNGETEQDKAIKQIEALGIK